MVLGKHLILPFTLKHRRFFSIEGLYQELQQNAREPKEAAANPGNKQ